MSREPDLLSGPQEYTPAINRLLPQSVEAEQGLLSSLLIEPDGVSALCHQKAVTTEFFQNTGHAILYDELMFLSEQRMFDGSAAGDFVLLCQVLRDRGKLHEIGGIIAGSPCSGAAFVSALHGFLPTSANATFYIEVLRDKMVRRKIIAACDGAKEVAYGMDDPVPQVEQMSADIASLARDKKGRPGIAEVTRALMEKFRKNDTTKLFGRAPGFRCSTRKLAACSMAI